MAVHESNFHAPCCEACGKAWGKTVPTTESDPFVTVLSKLHVCTEPWTHVFSTLQVQRCTHMAWLKLSCKFSHCSI